MVGVGAVRGGVCLLYLLYFWNGMGGYWKAGVSPYFSKLPSGAYFHSKSQYFLAKRKRGICGYWRRTWRGISLILAILLEGYWWVLEGRVSPYFSKLPPGAYFHSKSQDFLANTKRGIGGYWRRTWRGISLIFAIVVEGYGWVLEGRGFSLLFELSIR